MTNETNLTQASFSSGIISTEMFSRIDFNKIASGLKQCENFVIRPAGGAMFRAGTKYVSQAESNSENILLIPFLVDSDNGYCLEFGENYFRTYYHGKYTGNKYQTPIKNVKLIKYAQHKNKLYIVSPDSYPQVITFNDGVFSIASMKFNPDLAEPTSLTIVSGDIKNKDTVVNFDRWQYAASRVDADDNESLPIYSNIITNDISLTNQPIKITVAGETCHHYNIYRVKGGEFFLIYQLPYGASELTDISYALNESKSPKERFTALDGVYPQSIGIWNQRLILGNTYDKPNTMWGSRVGNYEDFTTTPINAADEGFELTFSANTTDYIRDFIPLDDLIVFTSSRVWRVSGTSASGMRAIIESYSGISNLIPSVSKKSILFVENSENVVSDFIYSYELNGYTGKPLSILARDLFEGYNIKSVAFRNKPFNVLHCVRSDGVLLSLTYLREENIYAWHKHTTNGSFVDVCSISAKGNDELYFIVKRNGVNYIELLADYISNEDGLDKAVYLDNCTIVQSSCDKYQKKKTTTSEGKLVEVFKSSTAGKYSLFIKEAGVYDVTLVGAGGSGSMSTKHSTGASGGSGAVFKGRVKISAGQYTITIGKGGSYYSDRDGTSSSIGTLIVAGGGSGGVTDVHGGQGGTLSVITEVVSSEISENGKDGFGEYGKGDYNNVESALPPYGNGGGGRKVKTSDGPYDGVSGFCEIKKRETRTTEIDDPNGIVYTDGSNLESVNIFSDENLSQKLGVGFVNSAGNVIYSGDVYYLKQHMVNQSDTVSGLDRFKNHKVTCVVNGNVYNNLLIENNSLVLPEKGDRVVIGFPYVGILETIPVEQKYSSENTTVGVNKKINDGILNYYRSRGLWYGRSMDKLYEVKPYTENTFSKTIPLESGKLILRVADGFNLENTFFVVQKSPMPALIQSITLGSTINDKY